MNEKLYGQFAELGRMPRAFLILRYNIAGVKDQVVPCELNERVELPLGEVTSDSGNKYNVLAWTDDSGNDITQYIPERYCTVLNAVTTNKVLVTLIYKLEGVEQSTNIIVRSVGSILANNSLWRYIGHPNLSDHVRHYYVGGSEVQLPIVVNNNVTIVVDDVLAIQNSTCELMLDYLCFPTGSNGTYLLANAPAFYLSEVSGVFNKGPTLLSEFEGNPAQISFDLTQSAYTATDDEAYNFIVAGFTGVRVHGSGGDPFEQFLTDNSWDSFEDDTILGYPTLRLLVNGIDYSDALKADFFDTIAYGRFLPESLGSYSIDRNSKTGNKMTWGSSDVVAYSNVSYFANQQASSQLHTFFDDYDNSSSRYKHFLWWGAGASSSPYSMGTIESSSGPEVIDVICNFHGVKSIRNVFSTSSPFGCTTEGTVTFNDRRFDTTRTYTGYDLTANNISVSGLTSGNVIAPRFSGDFLTAHKRAQSSSPHVWFSAVSALAFSDEFPVGNEYGVSPQWPIYVGNKVFN